MKCLILCVALAWAPLAACGSVPVGLPPGPIVVGAATTADDKAYAQALNAYTAAAQAYLTANRAGLVSPAAKARVKAASRTAIAALRAADTARHAGNAQTFAGQLALALQAASEIRALIPRTGA
jgi:hypothetical protein